MSPDLSLPPLFIVAAVVVGIVFVLVIGSIVVRAVRGRRGQGSPSTLDQGSRRRGSSARDPLHDPHHGHLPGAPPGSPPGTIPGAPPGSPPGTPPGV